MSIEIKSCFDKSFKRYGKVVEGIDLTEFVKVLSTKERPSDSVVYVASDADLEATKAAKEFEESYYGGLPIEVGYCNGYNKKLNAVEYHRASEINVAQTDAVLLLGDERDIEDDFTYDTSKIEAFKVPAGTAVEVYGTTLHYAPCNGNEEGFRVGIILPRGTNADLTKKPSLIPEDKLLTANNKWLIAHKDGGCGDQAFVGLKGENIEI